MKQRVITAIALLGLLAVVVWQIYTPVFILVISIFSAIAASEILKCAGIKNKVLFTVGIIISFMIPLFSSPSILEPIVSEECLAIVTNRFPTVVILTVIVLSYLLAMLSDFKNTKFEDVALSIVATIFVPSVFAMFGKLRDIYGYKHQFGVYLIFFALICALGTDVGAQLGGMAFGKTKMSPNISPKKTVEGAVCGIIFSLILNAIAFTLYNRLTHFPQIGINKMTVLFVAAPFISFMSMMGDLTFSVLKRNFNIKDFGKIFPGHGGVMDRFDSSMFTIALTYCVALVFI